MSNYQSDALNFTSSENYGQEGAYNSENEAIRAREAREMRRAEILKAAATKVQAAIGTIIGLNIFAMFVLFALAGDTISPEEFHFLFIFNGAVTVLHGILLAVAAKSPVAAAGLGFAMDGLIFVSNLIEGVPGGIIPAIIMLVILCQVSKETKM